VHAVEITDADKRGPEIAGDVVEFVKSQHSKSAKVVDGR
jgi:hypothetical protein